MYGNLIIRFHCLVDYDLEQTDESQQSLEAHKESEETQTVTPEETLSSIDDVQEKEEEKDD